MISYRCSHFLIKNINTNMSHCSKSTYATMMEKILGTSVIKPSSQLKLKKSRHLGQNKKRMTYGYLTILQLLGSIF